MPERRIPPSFEVQSHARHQDARAHSEEMGLACDAIESIGALMRAVLDTQGSPTFRCLIAGALHEAARLIHPYPEQLG